MLPRLYESYEPIGTLCGDIAEELGLSKNVKIIAGADDNAAAAIGTGTVGQGSCNISLESSGTIFISDSKFLPPRIMRCIYSPMLTEAITLWAVCSALHHAISGGAMTYSKLRIIRRRRAK